MATKDTHYCLGNGALGCNGCEKQTVWAALNDLPDPWRKKRQKEMTRIDDAECILSGRPYYEKHDA